MNKERILDLADIIENDRLPLVEFDMSVVAEHREEIHPECGTAACVAGHVLCAAYGNKIAREMPMGTTRAGEILGLSPSKANQLFYPSGWSCLKYTRSQAARVLRHLAKTGKVDWSIA